MINAMRKFRELLQIILRLKPLKPLTHVNQQLASIIFTAFNSIFFARKTMQILTITDNFISSLFLLAPHVTLILWYSVSPEILL